MMSHDPVFLKYLEQFKCVAAQRAVTEPHSWNPVEGYASGATRGAISALN